MQITSYALILIKSWQKQTMPALFINNYLHIQKVRLGKIKYALSAEII